MIVLHKTFFIEKLDMWTGRIRTEPVTLYLCPEHAGAARQATKGNVQAQWQQSLIPGAECLHCGKAGVR